MKIKRVIFTLILAAAFLAAFFPYNEPCQAIAKEALQRALYATVSLTVPIEGTDMASGGSGSILTSDGYILTNMHVFADLDRGQLYNSKGLAGVSINLDLRSAPQMAFIAELVDGDPVLDLALVKVVAYIDGSNLPADLNLPTLPVGNSDTLSHNDKIYVIGYPTLGGESVTLTEGVVSGFMSPGEAGPGSWIKTDAEVNHGNSGGAAINEEGLLIGVPTMIRTEPEAVGKINYIRPINEAAKLLSSISGQRQMPRQKFGGFLGANPSFGPLTFAQDIDQNSRPINPGTQFPLGTTVVYAVYEYQGMQDGLRYLNQWYYNGQKDVSSSGEWDGGASGIAWVNIYNNNGLAEGEYALKLLVEGKLLQEGSFRIASAAPTPVVQGVDVVGTITDVDTGRPISGAFFAALNPGVSIATFLAAEDANMIWALGKTDQRGYFHLDRPLERGKTYGVIVIAEGYQSLTEENFQVPLDVPSPWELDVTMQRG